MTTPEALNALADRVEREEPTWELTCEIEIALKPNARRSSNALYAVRSGLGMYNPPAYLHSLDAAVTLVPEKLSWFCGYWGGRDMGTARIYRPETGIELGLSDAKTPTQALTAAALRARASLTEE